MEGAAVTFDDNHRVRVLAQDKYDQTLALADSATEFCEKMRSSTASSRRWSSP